MLVARFVLALLFVLMVSLTLASCTDSENKGYAPWGCKRVPPETGFVVLRVTISDAQSQVPVTVYKGDYEENVVVLRDTLDTSQKELEMSVAIEYTFLASYFRGADTLSVLGSATLDVESDEYADATCYYVETDHIDLRLHE
jgi:hypothetical protein